MGIFKGRIVILPLNDGAEALLSPVMLLDILPAYYLKLTHFYLRAVFKCSFF